MALAMTHEEVVADLCRTEIKSHKQLPMLVYHIQTKFRDDPRPRAGLIRVREFAMKDSYSLDADEAGLDAQYRAHFTAYHRIFARCGLSVRAVGSDVGMMGGSLAHEFMYLCPVGEDTIVTCGGCGYAANRQVARSRKPAAPPEPAKPVESVQTPDTTSIEGLAALLGVPKSKTAKAVFMIADIDGADTFVFAVIRGDMEVNETKLANAVHARGLRPATEEEVRAIGAVPGYASPIGITRGAGAPEAARQPLIIVADDAVPTSPNLVAGANKTGIHLSNTNVPRDWKPDVVADVAAASEGDACPQCGKPLSLSRGVEVGNIFKLGTRYSEAFGATFLDAEGVMKPIVMGSYGIGLGRLLACVAEEHHDDEGLVWPITVAPFPVHITCLGPAGSEAAAAAERAAAALEKAGVEALLDDRAESPGVKFADADLIGIPIRLTVSGKSMAAGGIERVLRSDRKNKRIIAQGSLVAEVTAEMDEMRAALKAPDTVRPDVTGENR
jgi:prolyl-tRNA synthetase